MSQRIAVVMELPYVRLDKPEPNSYLYYYYWGDDFYSAGNPYVGLETRSATSPIFVELGGRIPAASSSEYFTLLAARSTDQTRREAFIMDAPTLQAAINFRETSEHGVATRFRIGPTLSLPGSNGDGDVEATVHYSFDIGYVGRYVRVGTGMSGSVLLNDYYYTGSNLGTRSANQIDIHGDFLGGPIRPGLGVRLPLGGTASQFPVVIGVTLAWVQ